MAHFQNKNRQFLFGFPHNLLPISLMLGHMIFVISSERAGSEGGAEFLTFVLGAINPKLRQRNIYTIMWPMSGLTSDFQTSWVGMLSMLLCSRKTLDKGRLVMSSGCISCPHGLAQYLSPMLLHLLPLKSQVCPASYLTYDHVERIQVRKPCGKCVGSLVWDNVLSSEFTNYFPFLLSLTLLHVLE